MAIYVSKPMGMSIAGVLMSRVIIYDDKSCLSTDEGRC